MNFRELEYMIALAEEKSINLAAERLFITPSALTQQLLKIESELGTSLFIRSRGNWQPTEAGEIYLDAARRILFIEEDAYREIQDRIRSKRYSITIGVPPERGTDIFSAIYPKFRKEYPEITVHLRELNVKVQQLQIAAGQIDIGFLSLAESQRTQDEYIFLRQEEILLAVPPNYPDALLQSLPSDNASPYRIVPLERLKNEPFAMMNTSSTLRTVQEDLFRQHGLHPNVSFETARFRTIFEMISYGLCCSLVCSHFVHLFAEGKAKIFSLPEHPTWDQVVSYRKGKYLSTAEKYFISLLKDYNQP